ncbi:MAG: zinc-binding alcohol dehydrogenase family protein, partial [Frondihabitans sp.]|nr:zinc-binding alcohol dehydrogenase family protein [Frondihabitans sp.]
ILGATGVAGHIAIQNAEALGAEHVIAVARNATALESLAAAGRTLVALEHGREATIAALDTAFSAHRPSVVLDFLWAEPAETVLAAFQRSGVDADDHPVTYIEIGEAAGPTASIPATLLRSTAITFRGSGAGSANVKKIMEQIPVFAARIADGTVLVPVKTYPLADIATAWQDTTPGRRIVLTP